MPKCPQCHSQSYRKNGRVRGKQRYRCKDCGRQFLEEALTVESPPEASNSGVSILLLDLENIRLDRGAESYLQELAFYPLQIKLAFANWGEPAVSKQDIDLYERGYFLVHVPGGKNSADARMMTLGSSIRLHYQNVQEVFVCSSDWLLTNLCNELLSQNLRVWRVRRQDKVLEIENRMTGDTYAYSLELNQGIPETKALMLQLENLLAKEKQSISHKIDEIAHLETLLQARKKIIKDNKSVDTQATIASTNENLNGNSSYTFFGANELEEAVIKIIEEVEQNSPHKTITPSVISNCFKSRFGMTANEVVKTFNLEANFTKFIEKSSRITLKKANGKKNKKVTAKVEKINTNSGQSINSSLELRQILINIVESFLLETGESSILLTKLGAKFKEVYGKSVSTVIKSLQLKGKFTNFLMSCEEFHLEKVGTVYKVSINNKTIQK
ncbi:hypothetical protein FRE64_07885 [Euhalothece natronophila Z-M001]|uniref:NYN domain-containing protein n=1 Tax=Euhalothece natronophila Z-M001 TaxID=522448 RepID=A0A5B8NLJ1_9CHRO|nr:hypothetical protein FRE64_07885 [Euhalothece natronophila Z-M001]